jgi:transcriptional regulator with PAS, ATPase and Fis domain
LAARISLIITSDIDFTKLLLESYP